MNKSVIYPIIYGLAAAVLFGASAPFSKLMVNRIEPITLSALLYLGSAVELVIFRIFQLLDWQSRFSGILPSTKSGQTEAKLNRADLPYLAGAILAGGVAAPILLMYGLKYTLASTASLMLNFEVVATTLIAALVFKEHIGRHALGAIGLITAASMLLSFNPEGQWSISMGTLGVLGATICWGIDNNLTRKISAKNPVTIGTVKGLVAGTISLILSLALGYALPGGIALTEAVVIGSLGYGLSIVFFILALRGLGAARTGAFFGIAPFAGVLIAFFLFREPPGIFFLIALPVMIAGVVLLLFESHMHRHSHPAMEHDHRHNHDDEHHLHEHSEESRVEEKAHAHQHRHDQTSHEGNHAPDMHHQHEH
ncbi:MAG: DMT family transporter [Candidatus Brocadiia bacterium]